MGKHFHAKQAARLREIEAQIRIDRRLNDVKERLFNEPRLWTCPECGSEYFGRSPLSCWVCHPEEFPDRSEYDW